MVYLLYLVLMECLVFLWCRFLNIDFWIMLNSVWVLCVLNVFLECVFQCKESFIEVCVFFFEQLKGVYLFSCMEMFVFKRFVWILIECFGVRLYFDLLIWEWNFIFFLVILWSLERDQIWKLLLLVSIGFCQVENLCRLLRFFICLVFGCNMR